MTDHRQRLLDVAQAEGRLTSVVGVVFDRHGAVWAGGAGAAPGLDGQYRIGSITKTLTAVLVMQARDEGLLSLDDTIGDHLGDVGYAEATVRDLLAHTAGLQSEPVGDWWERSRGTTFEQVAGRNDGSGRVAGPGEWFHYSNLGYALLGQVLSHVHAMPWRELVVRRLLEPLRMRQTSYLPRPSAQAGWSVDHFTGVRVHEPLTDTGAMAPAGQLWSTLTDLLTWGQFLAGSRPDLISHATLEEMRRPVVAGQGLGLQLSVHPGGQLVGHLGSMPGFLAALFVDPSSGIGSAVLANATTGVNQLELATGLLEGEPAGEVAPVVPWRATGALPPDVSGMPGLWFWGNTAFELRWHNEGLELRELGGRGVMERFELRDGELRGVAGYHRGERLVAVRDPFGAVRHLECATFVYTSVPYDPSVHIPGGHPEVPSSAAAPRKKPKGTYAGRRSPGAP